MSILIRTSIITILITKDCRFISLEQNNKSTNPSGITNKEWSKFVKFIHDLTISHASPGFDQTIALHLGVFDEYKVSLIIHNSKYKHHSVC